MVCNICSVLVSVGVRCSLTNKSISAEILLQTRNFPIPFLPKSTGEGKRISVLPFLSFAIRTFSVTISMGLLTLFPICQFRLTSSLGFLLHAYVLLVPTNLWPFKMSVVTNIWISREEKRAYFSFDNHQSLSSSNRVAYDTFDSNRFKSMFKSDGSRPTVWTNQTILVTAPACSQFICTLFTSQSAVTDCINLLASQLFPVHIAHNYLRVTCRIHVVMPGWLPFGLHL